MLRRSIATGIVALGLLSASGADLSACGDKFLRAGRSARQKNYAAAYPASILILKSATSTPEGLEYWRKILKQAGHATPVVVDGPGLSTAAPGSTSCWPTTRKWEESMPRSPRQGQTPGCCRFCISRVPRSPPRPSGGTIA